MIGFNFTLSVTITIHLGGYTVIRLFKNSVKTFALFLFTLFIVIGCFENVDVLLPPEDTSNINNVVRPTNDMVKIPAGSFTMGDVEVKNVFVFQYINKYGSGKYRLVEEVIPEHWQEAYTDEFWIDRNEVTLGEYILFLEATNRDINDLHNKKYLNSPVVSITLEEARAYAQWVGKRLPTSAEWEKAARGGLHKTPHIYENGEYPGYFSESVIGDLTLHPLGAFQIYHHKLGAPRTKLNIFGIQQRYTLPFYKRTNEYGIHDMGGNVSEWVDESGILFEGVVGCNYYDYLKEGEILGSITLVAAEGHIVVRGPAYYNVYGWKYNTNTRQVVFHNELTIGRPHKITPTHTREGPNGNPHDDYWFGHIGFRCVSDTPPQ